MKLETIVNTEDAMVLKILHVKINFKVNALSVNYTDNYVCINNDYLKDDDTNNFINLIENCNKYENDTLCVLCERVKYLANNRLTCINGCPLSY